MTALELPRFLLISGTGRDSGKTFLACNIIGKFKGIVPLIALKISPHRHNLLLGGNVLVEEENLLIAEETDPGSGKDSSRMLAAGAFRSFFIIATDEMLVKATEKIISLAGRDSFYVCEAGGLRRFANPGVFLIVSHQDESRRKPDPYYLKSLADACITGGQQHDFDMNRIMISENRWILKNSHDTL